MKTYKDELIKSMNYLAEKPNTIFVGQQTEFAGNPMSTTILEVSKDKRLKPQYLKKFKWVCQLDWVCQICVLLVFIQDGIL